jgi:succinate-acetate transporter protein
MAHTNEKDYQGDGTSTPRGANGMEIHAGEGRLPAFGGEFQPALYAPVPPRKFANPAPLGLCAFALTTFILSLINMGTRNLKTANIVVASAFAYGGFVQLLAGMW